MNIGIVGAGIMGRVLAFTLVHLGHKVTLIDKTQASDPNTASFIAGGMISPYAEQNADDSIFLMSQDALKRWKNIASKLVSPVTIYDQGSLLLAPFQHHEDLLSYIRRAQTLKSELTLLSHTELEVLEPNLTAREFIGVQLPNEGYMDNFAMMVALENTLKQLGATWLENTKVIAIKNHCVYTINDQITFDQVFDCRGLGAKAAFDDMRS